MDLARRIANHWNVRTLILDILNESATFLYEVFPEVKMWDGPMEAKKNLRKILEAYLMLQNNLKHDQESFREFLFNEATIYSAMDYLYKTLRSKNGESLDASLIAIWITLERREQEFKDFLNEYIQEGGPCKLEEALIAFWVLYGNQ